MRTLAELPRVDVLGTRVTASTFSEAVDALAGCVARSEPAVFSAANVYSVMLGHHDPAYRTLVNSAEYVMADGMPLVWAARKLGFGAERVHGDDLLMACAQIYPEWRWFLLGGAAGQPEAVRAELEVRFPKLRIAGTLATPIRPLPPEAQRRALDAIERSSADVVWVGMGTPAQDQWMAASREGVGRPLVGVGSVFDLLSGRTRSTPAWMQRIGLQWAHRLAQEPRRLGRRYAVYNTLFVWHFGRQLARRHRP